MKRFDKLIDISRQMNTDLDLHKILKLVVDGIADEITRVDMVAFFIRREDHKYYGHTINDLRYDISDFVIDPKEHPFIEEMINNKRSIYIEDTDEDQRVNRERMHLLHIKSILGVPVVIDQEVFGLVFVHDFEKPLNLCRDEMKTIEGFVNMSAVAIQNARMFQQTNRLLEQQKLLLEINHALSESLSVDDVMDNAFKYIRTIIGEPEIAAHLYNPSTHQFEPFYLSSSSSITEEEWKKELSGVSMNADVDGIFSDLLENKRAIAIYDVKEDERANQKIREAFDLKSLLIIPMITKGKVLGMISVTTVDRHRHFNESEIELCQTIADVTGTALSNALYTRTLDSQVKERTIELQEANLKLENLVKDLKELIRFKNDLMASLSHELRTPITSIMGATDILKKEIVGPLNEQQKKLVLMVDRATEKLLSRVNELLDFSKIEQGQVQLNKMRTSYSALVQETVEVMNPLFQKKYQTVHLEIPEHDPSIEIDKQKIQQVLINLLSNAHKFTPEGGRISIRYYKNGQRLITEVCDTGIGISPTHHRHIFSKFYQASPHKNGTGLGLAISKQLIELHNGEMWFHSEEGKGSMFAYSLPL